MTTATATTAAALVAGDIVEFGTMTGVARSRVADVRQLDVVIVDPARRTRTVYPTVRVTFAAGDSLDYAPDSTVTTVR